MSVIRKIEIRNFRSLKEFDWHPSAGLNCLIGPGDSGKSSVLDGVDYCLGARRNLQLTDADFHNLDVTEPISVTITIGRLDDSLKNVETYGNYLRGYDAKTGDLTEEPEAGLETVLTLAMTVEADLEPKWALVSARAAALGLSRNLNWADRLRLAPTRLGIFSEHNLSWRRGSILNRVSEERVDASAALVAAAREMRNAFGEKAKDQLAEALKIVTDTANELGIPVGVEVKAMLDAHSVSISGGAISLHDEYGVPLRSLGLGSARLLIAGLQRRASESASIVVVDELEYRHRLAGRRR
jgi:putative ATP-dependent endonuclease of the OLD family